MSVRDVARATGRSEETVRRWIWSGKLPATKLGNQLFVQRADLVTMQGPRTGEAIAGYSPSRFHKYSVIEEDLMGHRGEYVATKEEEARQIVSDEAFQDEIRARFGETSVLDLLAGARED